MQYLRYTKVVVSLRQVALEEKAHEEPASTSALQAVEPKKEKWDLREVYKNVWEVIGWNKHLWQDALHFLLGKRDLDSEWVGNVGHGWKALWGQHILDMHDLVQTSTASKALCIDRMLLMETSSNAFSMYSTK